MPDSRYRTPDTGCRRVKRTCNWRGGERRICRGAYGVRRLAGALLGAGRPASRRCGAVEAAVSAGRSADFQSAVSRVSNPPGPGEPHVGADWKSAIQQVGNLRYGRYRQYAGARALPEPGSAVGGHRGGPSWPFHPEPDKAAAGGRTPNAGAHGRAALRRGRMSGADAAAPYPAKRMECAGLPALCLAQAGRLAGAVERVQMPDTGCQMPTLWCCGGGDGCWRSADFQSAVSRVSNPPGPGEPRAGADSKSAIQQVGNLRYRRYRQYAGARALPKPGRRQVAACLPAGRPRTAWQAVPPVEKSGSKLPHSKRWRAR
jgi:hypothetical protein